jgi:hypothetical protein
MVFKKLLSFARLQRAPTRNQWFASEINMQRLRDIVTDPVFIAASNMILNERRIKESEVFNQPVTLPLRAAFASGHSTFLRDLEDLSRTPQLAAPLPSEWGYLDDDS